MNASDRKLKHEHQARSRRNKSQQLFDELEPTDTTIASEEPQGSDSASSLRTSWRPGKLGKALCKPMSGDGAAAGPGLPEALGGPVGRGEVPAEASRESWRRRSGGARIDVCIDQ